MSNITKKLEYYTAKVSDFKKNYDQPRNCVYCGKEITEYIVITTLNEKIFDLFNRPKLGGSTNRFNLCFECFERFHDLLEDIESEGWQILEEDSEEFEDLNNELEEENGSGK